MVVLLISQQRLPPFVRRQYGSSGGENSVAGGEFACATEPM
jgi:hypothetical protein